MVIGVWGVFNQLCASGAPPGGVSAKHCGLQPGSSPDLSSSRLQLSASTGGSAAQACTQHGQHGNLRQLLLQCRTMAGAEFTRRIPATKDA